MDLPPSAPKFRLMFPCGGHPCWNSVVGRVINPSLINPAVTEIVGKRQGTSSSCISSIRIAEAADPAGLMCDFARFSPRDMAISSAALRKCGDGASCIEEAGKRIGFGSSPPSRTAFAAMVVRDHSDSSRTRCTLQHDRLKHQAGPAACRWTADLCNTGRYSCEDSL